MSRYPSTLALRDGVAPSFLQLPAGPWPSLLAFLLERFPHIDAHTWRTRLECGQVFDQAGQPFHLDSGYPANQRIWYYREVEHEPVVPFEATLLYRDERLLVVDKPHFLACVPGGRHLRQTLLTRLRSSLSLPDLSPIHRLDRETAGVMLFCLDPGCRSAYQTLFQQQAVSKEYEAIAGYRADLQLPTVRLSRLQERADHFQMVEVAGEPNSQTRIELIEQRGPLARYRLLPSSGKKHQLRAHMAALGIGIYADPWYPQQQEKAIDDFSNPLRLLARSIHFTDPIDGSPRTYHSLRSLAWPEPASSPREPRCN